MVAKTLGVVAGAPAWAQQFLIKTSEGKQKAIIKSVATDELTPLAGGAADCHAGYARRDWCIEAPLRA